MKNNNTPINTAQSPKNDSTAENLSPLFEQIFDSKENSFKECSIKRNSGAFGCCELGKRPYNVKMRAKSKEDCLQWAKHFKLWRKLQMTKMPSIKQI